MSGSVPRRHLGSGAMPDRLFSAGHPARAAVEKRFTPRDDAAAFHAALPQ